MEEDCSERFKIIKPLGRGGMGEVYLAEDTERERTVAIKFIGANAWRNVGLRSRFQREAQAASRLDHPNICKIYEIVRTHEKDFLIMQYVDGVNLEQLLKMKPLPLARIVDIALQITEGMIAAQAQHIVHHDLKPGNIMIDKKGRVKILDFGLAEFRPRQTADRKARRPEPGWNENDIVLGTASYMSPEQLLGWDSDGRSDVFSFGVILYEMIENINPFSTPDHVVTFYNILHREVRFIRDAPQPLYDIVQRSLRKERGARYRDFTEIKADLLSLQSSPAFKACGAVQSREGTANLPRR